MPRPDRVHLGGGIYHVCNRLARDAMVFTDDFEAEAFVSVLREVKERDILTLFAWCLMGNHYHLALRVGKAPSGCLSDVHQKGMMTIPSRAIGIGSSRKRKVLMTDRA